MMTGVAGNAGRDEGKAAPSVKKNAIANFSRVFLNLIFPIVTFPYVTRILGPAGIGKVEFALSVVAYFMIFSSFGIPLYGIREIGRHQKDKSARDRVFGEIFLLHAAITAVALAVYIAAVFALPRLRTDVGIYLVFISYLVLSVLGADWYFQGLERYRYITAVNVAFKLVSLVVLFVFVRSRADTLSYAIFVASVEIGSKTLNFLLLLREIKLPPVRTLDLRRHLGPVLSIFLLNAIGSFYLNLDKIMLGVISGEFAVGIYAAANKVVSILITLSTSIGSVLLPRLSMYVREGRAAEFEKIATNLVKLLILLVAPSVAGLAYVAPEVIDLLAGPGFSQSALVLRILAPVVLLITLSHFTGVVVLYPRGQERAMMVSFIFGALLNIAVNVFSIPRFGAPGAAVATLLTEAIVLGIQARMCVTRLGMRFELRRIATMLVAAGAMLGCLAMLGAVVAGIGEIPRLVIKVVSGVAIYGVLILVFFRDELRALFVMAGPA